MVVVVARSLALSGCKRQELSIAPPRGQAGKAGRPLCSSAVLITNTHLPTSSRVVEIGVGSESDIGPVNTNRDPGEEMGWNVEFQPGVASIPRWAVQLSNLPYHPTQPNRPSVPGLPYQSGKFGFGFKVSKLAADACLEGGESDSAVVLLYIVQGGAEGPSWGIWRANR